MQGKRIVSLRGRGTDSSGGTVARHGRGPTRDAVRPRSRPFWRRSPCSSGGPSSPVAPPGRVRRRRSGRPPWSSLRPSLVGWSRGSLALPRPRSGRARRRQSPRSRSSPGPASRSGGRSPATAPGTLSPRASSSSRSASSVSRPPRLPGRPIRALALILAVGIGAVLVWALLGKAIPALGPDDAGRVARLKGSIDYWNALALLADAALGLGLWLVVSVSRSARLESAGAVLLYAATLVILLTQSRAGLLAGGRGRCTGALALGAPDRGCAVRTARHCPAPRSSPAGPSPGRRSSRTAARIRTASPPAGSSACWRSSVRPSSSSPLPGSLSRASPRPDGERWCAASSLQWPSPSPSARQESSSASATRSPGPRTRSVARARSSTAPGRLGSLESNNRTVWWGEAWQVFRANPAGGTGARTFEIARKRYRDGAQNVTEPHSVPLQILSDTGLPGLALAIAFVVTLTLGFRATLGRLEPDERAAAVGLVALPVRVRPPRPRRLRPRLPRRGRADRPRLGGVARGRPSRARAAWRDPDSDGRRRRSGGRDLGHRRAGALHAFGRCGLPGE